MIKCEVVEDFRLQDFKKLKNLVRKNADVEGKLYIGDTFECDEKMAEYLTGKNVLKKVVVKIIEVQPKEEAKEEKNNAIEVTLTLDKEKVTKIITDGKKNDEKVDEIAERVINETIEAKPMEDAKKEENASKKETRRGRTSKKESEK